MFLYTDGLVEAEDAEGREFGVERLEKLLVEERTADIEVVLEKVQRALQEHQVGDKAADDATLVVLRVPAGAMTPAAAGAAG